VTELVNAAAPGVVATDDERYNASLVRRVDQHENLAYFWVRFDGDPTPFEPGQYMTIGVFVDGRIVQRPYSVASAPVDAVIPATRCISGWWREGRSPRCCGSCLSGTGCG
jgi:hypothetical protein